jgi:Family of unknown function (DUF6476)
MNIRALKTLVAALGVLLVAGVVALVAAIGMRLSHRVPPPVAAFNAPPAMLPHGAKIEAVGAGADRIVLDIVLSDGTRQLIILETPSGRLIGTIPLRQD